MRLMFDSTTIADIPRTALMVAAYANGRFANYPQARSLFPGKPVVSISVNGAHHQLAHVLDIEGGDATIRDFLPWATAMANQGVVRPTAYASLGTATKLLELQPLGRIADLWVAHWTGSPHTVALRGANVVAVQFSAPGHGSAGHYDVSAVYDDTWHRG